MTPLPKRRHSTRRGGKRKAAIKLSRIGISRCKECGTAIIPHHICPICGSYKGKTVVIKKEKKAKKN